LVTLIPQWPLRRKIAVLTSLACGVVVIACGTGVLWAISRRLESQIDSLLISGARSAFDRYRQDRDTSALGYPPIVCGALSQPARYLEAEYPPGSVVFRTDESRATQLPRLPVGTTFADTMVLGEPLRVAQLHDGSLVIRLALNRAIIEQTQHQVMWAFIGVLPFALAAAGLIGWWLGGRTLSPIEDLTTAAEEITALRLHSRLPQPATNDEVARLTSVLNGMIDRLERSFLQARRFTADASHELRTPLTVLRGHVDALIADPAVPTSLEPKILLLQDAASRLAGIVRQLMLLSRADEGNFDLDREEIDLVPLVRDILDDAEILAMDTGITVEAELPASAMIHAHDGFLRQALLNLCDNGLKYGTRGGTLRLRLTESFAGWRLTVANQGNPIPPETAARIFDRFYRAAGATAPTGIGLGLSLAREIIRAHHGSLELTPNEPGWVMFTILLPPTKR
jgi:two-component system, OmpR family, heavy metal sensor histidine kinase CusS